MIEIFNDNKNLILSIMFVICVYGFFISVYDLIVGLKYHESDFINDEAVDNININNNSKINGRIILTSLLILVYIFASFSSIGNEIKYQLVITIGIILGIMFLTYQTIRRVPDLNILTKSWIRLIIFGLLSIILGFLISYFP